MKKAAPLTLIITMASFICLKANNFPDAMNQVWKTNHASNILQFAEINVATNRSPETLFARGVVAMSLQHWGRGATNFLNDAAYIASTNTKYSTEQRYSVTNNIISMVRLFSAITDDSNESFHSQPTWETNYHSTIFSELGGEFPFLYELESIFDPKP